MKTPSQVPLLRIRKANRAAIHPNGRYVLYWMIATRRTETNYSLQRAAEWCRELNRPLVILEALRVGYPWASLRLHRFIIEGMVDNAVSLKGRNALYYPYLEPENGRGKGLLQALSQQACIVVTDDFPCFFIPGMIHAAAENVPVALEVIDSNGILPLRAGEQEYKTAYSFRRFLQKVLPIHLTDRPLQDPLGGLPVMHPDSLPENAVKRWPPLGSQELEELSRSDLSSFPLDHGVKDARFTGGRRAGLERMQEFLENGLALYPERHNEPELEGTSGFSPYLHFGHICTHEIVEGIVERESASLPRPGQKATGKRTGWWGMGEGAEAFLDELLTWRELGFNMCHLRKDYDAYESLPDWARKTLDDHRKDQRAVIYSLDEFESGRTHDPLWNAAQMQLVREGRIHNYLRMLWGKKILEWSPSPEDALHTMITLNNTYAVDGRDPNSYSGIFWTLGRYDRAWGPERRIFGKVRYMSSENTARKVGVKRYVTWYAP
jgi:deoxyribodipyrimidine photo-lyase